MVVVQLAPTHVRPIKQMMHRQCVSTMVSVVYDHILADSAAWGSYSRRIGGSSIKYSHAKLHYKDAHITPKHQNCSTEVGETAREKRTI